MVRPFWPAIETPRVLGLNEANGSRRAMSRISRETDATLAMLSRSNTVTSGPLFSARVAVTTSSSTWVSPTAIGRTYGWPTLRKRFCEVTGAKPGAVTVTV